MSRDPFPHHGTHLRYHRAMTRIQDEQRVGQAIIESGAELPDIAKRLRLMDRARLRGFPIQARGVGGVQFGTNPVAELMASMPSDD